MFCFQLLLYHHISIYFPNTNFGRRLYENFILLYIMKFPFDKVVVQFCQKHTL